jgi:hypothetical protein
MIKNITVPAPRKTGAGFEKPAKVVESPKRSHTLLNLFGFIGEIAVPPKSSR